MKLQNIGFWIWLVTMTMASGDPPEIPPIFIPDIAAPDITAPNVAELDVATPDFLNNRSAISQERREAVAAKIAKAISNADSVSIASLEPNSQFLMEQFRPEMFARLRKDLLNGQAYYGSLTLDPRVVPKFSEAIISSIKGVGSPRLGFCWSPRHAIVIRKAKAPEIVVEICYQCGGMRLEDGEETLTFYPPRSIRKEMDELFDRNKIPRSTPIDERAGQGAAAGLKSEGAEKPKPVREGRSQ